MVLNTGNLNSSKLHILKYTDFENTTAEINVEAIMQIFLV